MDDEDLVCEIAEQILDFLGYDVVISRDGAQALQLYKEKFDQGSRYDAVIMDLNIPNGIGGKDAVNDLLKIDADAKVIVSSGYANDPIMEDPRSFGFSGCLAKPFVIDAIQKLLGDLLK